MSSFNFQVEILPALNTYRFSQTKLQILQNLALGRSNKSIAESLEISVKSVERILAELNKKLNKSNEYKNFYKLFNPRVKLLSSLIALDLIDFKPEVELRYIDNLDLKLSQVLALMAIGFANKKIAELLGINEKTVELRLTQLFDYFNIDTKNQSIENPRISLFISALCRSNISKAQIKRLHKETSAGRVENTILDLKNFISTLEEQHKVIG
ncbi:MAG: Bacterial regulatory protein luxR family [Cyanobacteriota bacterium]|jgi:DNA-binding NarL/FixJ family response regulator